LSYRRFPPQASRLWQADGETSGTDRCSGAKFEEFLDVVAAARLPKAIHRDRFRHTDSASLPRAGIALQDRPVVAPCGPEKDLDLCAPATRGLEH